MENRGSALTIVASILVLIVVGVVGGGGFYLVEILIPQWRAEQEQRALAEQWAELRRAVVVAGTPLVDSPKLKVMDYNAQASRLLALRNNSSQNFENVELSKTWAQIETDTSEGLVILQRIGHLEANKPSGYQILAQSLSKDEQTNQQAATDLEKRIADEVDIADLEAQFRATEAKLNDSIADLQNVASGLSRTELPSAPSIQYYPSWMGTYANDTVQVTNSSSSDLQDAIVFVTVHMKDGSTRVHPHYVDRWQSKASLGADYTYQATDFASSQSGDAPDNIEVAAYTPSGTAKATYTLTPDEWDRIVKSYCSGIQFSGNLLDPYDETYTNQHYDSGYQFQFQGLPTLPVTSVEVRFTSDVDGSIHDKVWLNPAARLSAGKPWPLRDAELNHDGPVHADLILRFAGTNYALEVAAPQGGIPDAGG